MPLAGVRVLDLTQFLAGPFCTMVLGDMGADVVKVEPPTGEPMRNAMRVDPEKESLSFLSLNRNKRGIVVDLSAAEGRALFHELVAQADVLVENFRPGVTTRLEIDYDTLRRIRPELVYASITGFGDVGSWAQRPGLDAITQGMSGLMSVTGSPDGEPAKVGVPVTDLTAGLYGVIGILNAYITRLSTGEGQRVATSLFQAGLALAIHESSEYWSTGQVPGPLGSAHRFAAPYQAVRAKDGYLTVGAGTQKLWERMCVAIDREDLLADERFVTNGDRMGNRDALQAELERTFATRPAVEWADVIVEAGVPAGPILDYHQVLEAPHTNEVGMVAEYDHPTQGRLKTLGTPVTLSGITNGSVRAAPLLGEHTDEVLAELGLDEERIASLHEQGVV